MARCTPSVIWELLNDGAMSEEHRHESLHHFVEDAQLFLRSNKFASNYDAIAMMTSYQAKGGADIQRIWIRW